MIQEDRNEAIRWARALFATDDWVILDTETTGLNSSARLVQVAVIGPDGSVRFNSLVNPEAIIPPDATGVHGITETMVRDAPTVEDLYPALVEVLCGKRVVAYNADFDRMILRENRKRHGLPGFGIVQWLCAMRIYSEFAGEWNEQFQSYRFQGLPGKDHTALGDCLATLAVIHRIAESSVQEPSGF